MRYQCYVLEVIYERVKDMKTHKVAYGILFFYVLPLPCYDLQTSSHVLRCFPVSLTSPKCGLEFYLSFLGACKLSLETWWEL